MTLDKMNSSLSPNSSPYPIPPGVHPIPIENLDLRPDSEIDTLLRNPPHPSETNSEKNIWFYWHTGYSTLPPHHRRTVHNYHRRFSPQGWTIRVVDQVPYSPLNISNYLNINDPTLFPAAFADNTLEGTHAVQHSSDLVRWPLLLTYGGIYADVGLMQIGDLDRLWHATVADPSSPYEVIAYDGGETSHRTLHNYFFASRKQNRFFLRCHKLLLKLWSGKTTTEGLHAHPLLSPAPLMGKGLTLTENGRTFSSEECAALLTDYIIQGQVMTLVLGLRDPLGDGGWDGPRYAETKIYTLNFIVGSQLINEYTKWNGPLAYRLMSLPVSSPFLAAPSRSSGPPPPSPPPGETDEEPGKPSEDDDHKLAREIVENCLSRSFSFKLATGIILRFYGDTLGSLWKKNPGSDDVPGTYAHWLRYGTLYWTPNELPQCVRFEREFEPFKTGPLLEESY